MEKYIRIIHLPPILNSIMVPITSIDINCNANIQKNIIVMRKGMFAQVNINHQILITNETIILTLFRTLNYYQEINHWLNGIKFKSSKNNIIKSISIHDEPF